jgi:hypothetical protein
MKLTEEQIAAIQALENEKGELTPDQVVEAAKPKGSVLHDLFVWDKALAARAHWIQTAREIIGAVRVVVTTATTTVRTPMYVRDPDANGQGYRSVSGLRADPAAARESLIYTLEVASGHLRRAFDLAGPLGLADEIDQLVVQVAGVQRLVRDKAA